VHLTGRYTYPLLGLLACVLALLLLAGVALAAPTLNSPVNNSSQVDNAIALSTKAFPSGAPAVVVTVVDSYADSLAAPVLASVYGGPLLFTSSSSLSPSVATELARLKPQKVFLVGLSSTLVAAVQAAVPGLTDPEQIVVIKGSDRYETAALVAREIAARQGSVSQAVIVPGDNYYAAVAASTLAANRGWPLILTPAAGPFPQVSADTLAELGLSAGLVVGTNLTPSGFTVTKRITGTATSNDPDGRYDLCAKLADYAASQGWLSFAAIGLVPGDKYSDGQIAAAYLAKDKGVLLFSKASALAEPTATALKTRATQIKKIDFVGLGWPVYREVKSLNSPRITGLSATGGPVAGGNKVVVTGSALTGVTKVRVGKVDVPSSDWKVDSATQLTILSMPPAFGPGPAEVTAYNFWGASPANVKDIYLYRYDGPVPNGHKIVEEAIKYVGIPYLWAGESPSTGFDCSGLVKYVYSKFGISLPHYSRSQATYGTAVAKEDLLPGDLVFFYSPISHVGIYVGGGLMINAPRSGDLVTIEDAFRSSYNCARRLISPYFRYEENDANLAYSGTWSSGSSSSYSGGSFRYTKSAGASVTVTFSGTSLCWITKKSPVYGKAKVTLDGQAPVTIDLYSASTLYQQKVWETGKLASGTHTVKIEWTGLKNSAASNTYINLDAFDVLGTLAQASVAPPSSDPTVTRYEQDHSKIAYTGTWLTYTASGSSGGSYKYADSAATATITFSGTRLDWIATKGYTMGKAAVSLDGGAPVTVDLYNSTTLRQQKVWSTGALADGVHTVVISWLGQRSQASGGTRVSLDAVDIVGTLTQVSATPAAAPSPPPTRYEQKDSRFAYAGGWTAVSATDASGGSYRRADEAGATVTVTFDGTYLAWIAAVGPRCGKAKVSVDDSAPVTVDLYNSSVTYQKKVWDTGTLVSGTHTIRIEWTGTKNAGATESAITVDAFDIVGTVTQAPPPTPVRYEQTEPWIVYAGTWKTSSTASASGGSFRYANSNGASITVSFVGSSLAWIAKTSPVYGKARVIVDGKTVTTVDLYSPAVLWKQKVWDTGSLTPYLHTVRIEWTGTRNSRATDTNIGVDAFDLVGSPK